MHNVVLWRHNLVRILCIEDFVSTLFQEVA